MLRFALNQPRALGDFEDAWTGQTVYDDVVDNLVAEGLDPAYQGVPASIVAPKPSGGGFFDSIWAALTAKPVVNAALNKYVFGANAIPTGAQYTVPPSAQWIAGVPNSYLMIGAAAVALLTLSKKRR